MGTFDLGPEVLEAVRDGELAFAIDQQGYLQGYLPVVMLAQRARYGLHIGDGPARPHGAQLRHGARTPTRCST